MRIAMISYHTCPRASLEGKETGGMNVYVRESSLALVRLGHTVDIFTRSHEMNDPLVVEDVPGLRVFHIPAGPRTQVPKKRLPLYIDEFVRTGRTVVLGRKLTYDVMHAHYYMSGLAAKKVLELAHIPFVMTFHTLALMKNLVARDTLEHESQERIHTEFSLVRRANAVTASSEIDREYLITLYDADPSSVHVVYPGIDHALFHPADRARARNRIGAQQNHKIILFVGRIEPLKGIDTLLYALKILRKRNPRQTICLWIVGGDISEPESRWPKTLRALAQLRKTLGIPQESVHFVGRKSQTELPDYYNAADVVVMPSHYESFGITALEAINCATPVIVTNVAGIMSAINVGQAAHMTTVNNPLLLAAQIAHVLADPIHALRFARNARESVASLTWEHAARDLTRIYASVT